MDTLRFIEYSEDLEREIMDIPEREFIDLMYTLDQSIRYCYTVIKLLDDTHRMFCFHIDKATVREVLIPDGVIIETFVVDPYIGVHGRCFAVTRSGRIASFDIKYKN